nr:hypothetical protein TetV2_00595 [Oceanusvirus sp.]
MSAMETILREYMDAQERASIPEPAKDMLRRYTERPTSLHDCIGRPSCRSLWETIRGQEVSGEPFKVFRGTCVPHFNASFGVDHPGRFSEGDTIRLREGLLSASLRSEEAQKFLSAPHSAAYEDPLWVAIRVRRRGNAVPLYIGHLSVEPRQEEVVFGPGSVFRVQGSASLPRDVAEEHGFTDVPVLLLDFLGY